MPEVAGGCLFVLHTQYSEMPLTLKCFIIVYYVCTETNKQNIFWLMSISRKWCSEVMSAETAPIKCCDSFYLSNDTSFLCLPIKNGLSDIRQKTVWASGFAEPSPCRPTALDLMVVCRTFLGRAVNTVGTEKWGDVCAELLFLRLGQESVCRYLENMWCVSCNLGSAVTCVQYPVYTLQCILYSLQYTVYNCTVDSMMSNLQS